MDNDTIPPQPLMIHICAHPWVLVGQPDTRSTPPYGCFTPVLISYCELRLRPKPPLVRREELEPTLHIVKHGILCRV